MTCLKFFAGTRDFGPAEYRQRQWLFSKFEHVSRLFGFEQFETPVLESEELFVRKAGEEITQQLYNFEVLPSSFECWYIEGSLCLSLSGITSSFLGDMSAKDVINVYQAT